jgi:hypothetical protein
MYCICKDPKGEKIFLSQDKANIFDTVENDSIDDIVTSTLLNDQQKIEKLSMIIREMQKKTNEGEEDLAQQTTT